MKRLCVNFLSGPSGGKTTASASLFTRLKRAHYDVELVAEFPKDLVLEGNKVALANQLYVLANQLYRIECAYLHTNIAIVDSPIILSMIYNADKTSATFKSLILEQHRKFNNLNVFVPRYDDAPHSMIGRIHTREESEDIDQQILELCDHYNLPLMNYADLGEDGLMEIIEAFLEE